MRRFALAIGIASILLPGIASATAATPAQLFSEVAQDTQARSFSTTVHAGSQGTYLSVWASGTQQGGSTLRDIGLTLNVTVDIMAGKDYSRVKGQLLIVDGTAYVQVLSAQGALRPAITSVLQEKQWIRFPLPASDASLDSSASLLTVAGTNSTDVDAMFTMKTTTKNGIVTHVLGFAPDFAAEIADQLRSLIGDTGPISNDWFPWRALADTVTFSMTVNALPSGSIVSSSYTFQMKTPGALVTVKGAEKALQAPIALQAPADAVDAGTFGLPIGDLITLPQNSTPSSPALTAAPSIEIVIPDSFDQVDTARDPVCDDPTIEPPALLQLQKIGACPVAKTPTRFRK